MVGRRPRERSVGLRDPNFLRRAARGGPGRSAGQNRKRGARSETLRDPLTLPAAAAINQEMMPRQHTWRTPHLGTCSRGWSDGPARRWWVVGQGGRTGEGDLGGGVVRQDVIRVQVPGGQTRAARHGRGRKMRNLPENHQSWLYHTGCTVSSTHASTGKCNAHARTHVCALRVTCPPAAT